MASDVVPGFDIDNDYDWDVAKTSRTTDIL